jgi:hypothetical protein
MDGWRLVEYPLCQHLGSNEDLEEQALPKRGALLRDHPRNVGYSSLEHLAVRHVRGAHQLLHVLTFKVIAFPGTYHVFFG